MAGFLSLFKKAFQELLKNDPLRMAAATAFFTLFALPPILLIIILMLRWLIEPHTLRPELWQNLSSLLGSAQTGQQIHDTLHSIHKLARNRIVMIFGFVFLLFVATTLFKVIKDSINDIWKIRPSPHKKVWLLLLARVQALLVILVAGVLFVVGLVFEGIQAFIGKELLELSSLLSLYFNGIFNYIVPVVIVTLWFAVLLRYLPDGRPTWKIALTGGFLTSLLFNAGKLLLHVLLNYSNINTLYGTSASLVLLLLFVFYSSLILYYGAAFTKVWASYKKSPIKLLHQAVHYRIILEKTKDPEKPAG